MNVIFVCTGNTCRSPMAEYYLNSKNLDNIFVKSRGFSGGEKANPNSIEVMNEVGLDLSHHKSSCITKDELENADIIICMSESHRQLLISTGADKNKLFILGEGIPDPFGFDIETYRDCRDNIFKSIDALLTDGFFKQIKISNATKNDIPAIANIEKLSFSTPWSENAIRESMNAGTAFYIARKNDVVVGYMGLSKIAGEGYVTNIAVLPQYRQQGIGKTLLDYAIKDSLAKLEFISLEVRVSNVAAISLYESFGFEKVGLRKCFYTNPSEDALIMTKNFI